MKDVLELPQALHEHLTSLRVAVYGSGGAPSHHLALLTHWGLYPHVVYAHDILSGRLTDYDAVIFPGGGLSAMAGQLTPLGAEGMTALRHWTEAGGLYLGSCAGSCHPLRMGEAYTAAHPGAGAFQVCDVTPLNAAAGAWGLESPGTGRLQVAPEAHPLFEGLYEPFEIVHYNGPLFPAVDGAAGRVVAPTDAFTPFEVSQGDPHEATTLTRAITAGARVVYQQRVGTGQVILFGSHPEFGWSALQLGWLPAARLLANALGLAHARACSAAHGHPGHLSSAMIGNILKEVQGLEYLLGEAAPLEAGLPLGTPAFMGMSGPTLWDAAVGEALCLLVTLRRWLEACPTGMPVRGLHLLEASPNPGQDVGFMGVRQGLSRACEMTQRALELPAPWPPFSGAYNELATHPYHLLVSSYLSACGLIAANALQLSAFAVLNALPPLPLMYKEPFHAA